MDESTPLKVDPTGKPNNRLTLGINSFNSNDQQQFDRHVRLAMACIEGKEEPANIKALSDDDNSLFDFERALRDDRESFNTIRALSPTRYRFRIVDANGCDIRYVYDATNISANTNTNTLTPEAPQQAMGWTPPHLLLRGSEYGVNAPEW